MIEPSQFEGIKDIDFMRGIYPKERTELCAAFSTIQSNSPRPLAGQRRSAVPEGNSLDRNRSA
jgi:hypothetical protein